MLESDKELTSAELFSLVDRVRGLGWQLLLGLEEVGSHRSGKSAVKCHSKHLLRRCQPGWHEA